MTSLSERYFGVLERIAKATSDAGRSPEEVHLIVVTKNHPVDLVKSVYDLGARDFGENRDQEAKPKSLALAELIPDSVRDYRWHFIGQLQSNKVKSVLDYADVIHSLDRQSLLTALVKEVTNRRLAQPGFSVKVFVQMNLTDNPERGGIQVADLLAFADQVVTTDGLELLGVMAVGSLENTPEHDFALVREASELLQRHHPSANQISAGMSEDFETAIRFGATHLRIGTSITGKRDYNL